MLCSFIRSTIAEFFVYENSDLISSGVIGSPALPVNAAETPLIKTEVFRSDTADFSYDFKDEIEENGQRYKLGNDEYTVLSEKDETEIRHEVTTETVDNLYGLITVTCDVLAAVKVTENKAVVGELRVNFRPYLGILYHILVFNNVLAVDDQIQVERRTCVVLGISGLCYGLCRVVCAVLFSKNVTSAVPSALSPTFATVTFASTVTLCVHLGSVQVKVAASVQRSTRQFHSGAP